jgi:hypothetical protein
VKEIPPKKCLFIGMSRKIPNNATVQSLLKMTEGMHKSDLCDLRDGARLIKAAEFGFNIFSLDRKYSCDKRHFSLSLEGFDRERDSVVIKELKAHIFTEITVDFVWMPATYLYDTVLTKTFFSRTLHILAEVLEDHGRLYFPATKLLFERLVQFWPSLRDLFILRFIRHDQLEESCLYRATVAVPMHLLGKECAEKQVSHYGLCLKEVESIPLVPSELLNHFPQLGSCVRFLCLSKKV